MSEVDALRYRLGRVLGTVICPVCGCVVEDATAHTKWHESVGTLAQAIAQAMKAKRIG